MKINKVLSAIVAGLGRGRLWLGFLLLAAGASSAQSLPPSGGLVSWWRGEGDAVDAVEGTAGKLLKGVTFAAGKVGQAFSFDGVGGHVRVPDRPGLRLTQSLTLAAWVYPTRLGGSREIISKWDLTLAAQQMSYTFALSTEGRIYFLVSPNGTPNSNESVFSLSALPLNQWSHVAGTYDGTALRMYINGVLENQVAYWAGIFPGTSDLALGGVVGGGAAGQVISPFAGLIDEPSIYQQALTAEDIQALYDVGSINQHSTIDAGKVGQHSTDATQTQSLSPPGGLVSWWRGEGDATDAVEGVAGELMNGATFSAGKVGQAFSFDGFKGHVRVPDRPSLRLTKALTIEAWVYPTRLGIIGIVEKWDLKLGPNQMCFSFAMHADGRIYLLASPNGTPGLNAFVSSTSALPLNQWRHVAGTYDGTALRIFFNGVMENQVAYHGGIFPGTNDLAIGGVVGGGSPGQVIAPFAGRIDEIRLYSRALAAAEIQAIFDADSASAAVLMDHPTMREVTASSNLPRIQAQSGPATVSQTLATLPAFSMVFRDSVLSGTISGSVGETFSIEYAAGLSETNAWIPLFKVTLTSAVQSWSIPMPMDQPQGFYRAVKLP